MLALFGAPEGLEPARVSLKLGSCASFATTVTYPRAQVGRKQLTLSAYRPDVADLTSLPCPEAEPQRQPEDFITACRLDGISMIPPTTVPFI